MDASAVAMPSSGDPVKDQQDIALHVKQTERMEDGVCPNGCAIMNRCPEDPDHTRICPVCNFVGWQNTPLPKDE